MEAHRDFRKMKREMKISPRLSPEMLHEAGITDSKGRIMTIWRRSILIPFSRKASGNMASFFRKLEE
jgi:hypothetical protein